MILFGPVGGSAQRIVNGIPMGTGGPIPFKASSITPNLGGAPDTTDDMRSGMGIQGVANLAKFIEDGGLFITITSNASIPIDYGLAEGVSIQPTRELRAQGSVLNAVFADRKSPIAYGYGENLAVYFNQAPVLNVAAGGGFGGGRGGRGGGNAGGGAGDRPSGRGTPTDPDIPQGRPLFVAPGRLPATAGATPAVDDESGGGGGRGGPAPNPAERPRIVLRFADERDLFVSGMLSGGAELAGKPAVIDVQHGKGHVLMFANNPMWRSETHGSYFLLFNAMMNFSHLDAGRVVPPAPAVSGQP